jgi:hypothetical protein
LTPDTINALLDVGTPGLLLLAIVAFWRGWVVRGALYDKTEAERDRLVELRYQDAIETREIAKALLRRGE